MLLDFSERGYSNTLWIYRRGTAGDLSIQQIDGWKMGNLKTMVRDLDSDGRDELIIPTELGPEGSWSPLMAMPVWPTVYLLKNGRYIEASHKFPEFYNKQVLPSIGRQILRAKARTVQETFQQRTVAVLEMERDKILRVLGRDTAAGLRQAYQWMNSDDPQVLQCAIATFTDIGGHEKEVRVAQQALPAAIQHEVATRAGG